MLILKPRDYIPGAFTLSLFTLWPLNTFQASHAGWDYSIDDGESRKRLGWKDRELRRGRITCIGC